MNMINSEESAVAALDQLRSQLPAAFVEVELPSVRVTYLNAIAQTLLGYDETDIAAGLNGFELLDEESRQRAIEISDSQLAENVALGLPYQRLQGQRIHQMTAIHKDGTHFPVELQAAYILDERQFPVGIRFIVWDLSERHRLEEERRQLERQARQSQKLESLGLLAGGVAHEFNNVLTAVNGNLFLLREHLEGNDAALELIEAIECGSDRATRMVRGLLQFSRPDVEPNALTDLAELTRDTVELVRPSLPLSTHIALAALPEGRRLMVDTGALQQVLVNLLVNAIEATAQGGVISVSLSRCLLRMPSRWAPPDFPEGVYHVISISDAGPGIPCELQERIFDPYFSTKDTTHSRGLGLSISLGIARSHGGWLSVESTPGEGSTFRLLLPQHTDASGSPSHCPSFDHQAPHAIQ